MWKLAIEFIAICSTFCIVAQSSPIHDISRNNSANLNDEDASFIGLYSMFGGGNPRKTPSGETVVEGDIVLPALDQAMKQRKATADISVYWPNGEVVYTYHESISQAEMNVIEAAMQHWRHHTCIKFRPRQATDFIFIRFRSDTQGCWSLVGRQADRVGQGQDVSIGPGCANLNVVVHEIGHVLGFYHEQSRSDRDQYIEIIWGNVLPGYALQFRKESDSNYNIPYDLTSTMQYPQWAFSKEIFEKSTIVAKNPSYQRFLSKNYPLSFRDRMLANQLYACTNNCAISDGSCFNGGYLRSSGYNSANHESPKCSCDCPPNFAGPRCETKIRDDYYDALPCGGQIDTEGIIQTPGYPQRTEPNQSCMWDIRAPEGKVVRIKFDGFEFAPRFTKAGTKVINKCFNETVEIRLDNNNIYDGVTYCGADLAPGTVLRSNGHRALIIITANDKMLGRGLSARIKFVRPGDNDDQDEDINQVVHTTRRPLLPDSATTPKNTTLPPTAAPEITTQPPVMPPQPPPSVVTTSSLLEQYERESKKTLPPVFPY